MPNRSELTRRQVLAGAATSGVLVAFGGQKALARDAARPPRLPSDPFTLGVASGDPLPDGVVLWTRLAPEPLTADGGLGGAGNLAVGWEIAHDEGMRRVVRRGRAVAPADLAHAVHVDVRGLEPGRDYWYRFTAGDWATPPARTRTAPRPRDALDRVDFAYATCQKWEERFYNAYAHMAEEDLDLVVFLGDYTYEYGIDPATGGVRGVELPATYADETVTLDQFRLRHALYMTDGDLRGQSPEHRTTGTTPGPRSSPPPATTRRSSAPAAVRARRTRRAQAAPTRSYRRDPSGASYRCSRLSSRINSEAPGHARGPSIAQPTADRPPRLNAESRQPVHTSRSSTRRSGSRGSRPTQWTGS
jgi:PhoD-like phosphatase, N-terminal domain/PhoD-like phosphatase